MFGFVVVTYSSRPANEISMNGLGFPKRIGQSQVIPDALTTTKCVKIGAFSGTGSDYTVQEISCIRFWSSRHTSKETRIDMMEIYL